MDKRNAPLTPVAKPKKRIRLNIEVDPDKWKKFADFAKRNNIRQERLACMILSKGIDHLESETKKDDVENTEEKS